MAVRVQPRFTPKLRHFISTTESDGTAARFCTISRTLHVYTDSKLPTGKLLRVMPSLLRKGRGERARDTPSPLIISQDV